MRLELVTDTRLRSVDKADVLGFRPKGYQRLVGREPTMSPSNRTAAIGTAIRKALRRARYAERTRNLYAYFLMRFEDWLREERRYGLSHATPTDVLDFADGLPMTYSTRMQFVCAYKAYWRHCLGHGRRRCPSDDVYVPPKPDMTCKAIDDDEVDAVLKAARNMSPRTHAIVALLYYAGLRRGEVAQLARSADEGRWLRVVGKGNKQRTLFIDVELREILDAYYNSLSESSPWMFPGRTAGSHMSPATVWSDLRLVGAAAGVPDLRPHRLRHTAAATMNDDENGNLRTTATFLGHSPNSLNVTAGYTRTGSEKLVAAAVSLRRRKGA